MGTRAKETCCFVSHYCLRNGLVIKFTRFVCFPQFQKVMCIIACALQNKWWPLFSLCFAGGSFVTAFMFTEGPAKPWFEAITGLLLETFSGRDHVFMSLGFLVMSSFGLTIVLFANNAIEALGLGLFLGGLGIVFIALVVFALIQRYESSSSFGGI